MKYYIQFDPITKVAHSLVRTEREYENIPTTFVEVSHEMSLESLHSIALDSSGTPVVTPTPLPSFAHAWDGSQWYLHPERFSDRKRATKGMVDGVLRQALDGDISVGGVAISPDVYSLTSVKELVIAGAPIDFVWRDVSNNFASFDSAEQFLAWLNEALQAISVRLVRLRNASWALKAEIDATTTPEALEVIAGGLSDGSITLAQR